MRAFIFANGVFNYISESVLPIGPEDLIIAVDGGTLNCQTAGVTPHVVIGDMDSLPITVQEALKLNGVFFLSHPKDKDQTDLDLGLEYAINNGASLIILVALLGGRLDQTLANLLLLTRPEWRPAQLVMVNEQEIAYLVREGESMSVFGNTHDIVSLIPLTPNVTDITTQGLRWNLTNATLNLGTTLSISNELADTTANIQIGTGQLMVIHTVSSDKKPED